MMGTFKRYVNTLLTLGITTKDHKSLKLKKSSVTLIFLITAPASTLWAFIYISLDHYIAASMPLFYTIMSLGTLFYFHKSKNIVYVQKIQMLLILLLPFLLMWSLGGFALGSFVMIWSFFAPIAALTYDKSSKSLYWFYAFLFLVFLSFFMDSWLIEHHIGSIPKLAEKLFYLLNISAGLSGIYFLIKYFINEKEKNANERLKKEHETLLQSSKDLKEANLKLSYIAHHDSLTNLPNRYYLREHLEKMISLSKRNKLRLALLFLDLDNFKQVNDDFGHLIGDKVLQMVSERMKALLRKEDLVARLGGDEFAIAIGSVKDLDYVKMIAQRLISEISRDYECLNHTAPIGVSIGISLYPSDSEDLDTLINKADKAMYQVKQNAKNSFLFFTNS